MNRYHLSDYTPDELRALPYLTARWLAEQIVSATEAHLERGSYEEGTEDCWVLENDSAMFWLPGKPFPQEDSGFDELEPILARGLAWLAEHNHAPHLRPVRLNDVRGWEVEYVARGSIYTVTGIGDTPTLAVLRAVCVVARGKMDLNRKEKAELEKLWSTIMAFVIAAQELGAEGNSGEFHDPNNYRKIRKELKEAECALLQEFVALTGWLPRRAPDSDEHYMHGVQWTLEEKPND